MTDSRSDRIRSLLSDAFAPAVLEVVDESHLHAGHAGAKDGRGHFRVTIESPSFAGKSPLQCHRMVFAAVGTLMDTDIHALSVTARPPAE
jgi:BolA protein